MEQALRNVYCYSDVSRRHFLNKIAIVRTFFLNQLIQFYSNNATNLHHLTTDSTTCWPTKCRSHCDHRYVTSLCPMYKTNNLHVVSCPLAPYPSDPSASWSAAWVLTVRFVCDSFVLSFVQSILLNYNEIWSCIDKRDTQQRAIILVSKRGFITPYGSMADT